MTTAQQAGRYLETYIRHYRSEYRRFTAPAPDGGGYPALPVSPYQYGGVIECFLAKDGAVILDSSREPEYEWAIAGGPALMSDYEPTRVPAWVKQVRDEHGIKDNNGIYRMVGANDVPPYVWAGKLGESWDSYSSSVEDVEIRVTRYRYDWLDLLRRLTFGSLGHILDLHLPDTDAEFWNPRIIRSLGFFPADYSSKRFVNYGELLRHADLAAWEPRTAWARAHLDLRRDFADAVSGLDGGASLSFEDVPTPTIGPPYRDRLDALRHAINGLAELLSSQADGDESIFHDYLFENPVLLDVYGKATSKPRFRYPDNSGPTGKSYVEPDFVLTYPNQTYKLVELERPSHGMATRGGHPRAAVTHAAYQIAEWQDYINRHYDQVKDAFPGIAGNNSGIVIISRDTLAAFPTVGDRHHYMSLLRQQFGTYDILTYDDVLIRARTALQQLESLAVTLAEKPGASVPV